MHVSRHCSREAKESIAVRQGRDDGAFNGAVRVRLARDHCSQEIKDDGVPLIWPATVCPPLPEPPDQHGTHLPHLHNQGLQK